MEKGGSFWSSQVSVYDATTCNIRSAWSLLNCSEVAGIDPMRRSKTKMAERKPTEWHLPVRQKRSQASLSIPRPFRRPRKSWWNFMASTWQTIQAHGSSAKAALTKTCKMSFFYRNKNEEWQVDIRSSKKGPHISRMVFSRQSSHSCPTWCKSSSSNGSQHCQLETKGGSRTVASRNQITYVKACAMATTSARESMDRR